MYIQKFKSSKTLPSYFTISPYFLYILIHNFIILLFKGSKSLIKLFLYRSSTNLAVGKLLSPFLKKRLEEEGKKSII